MEETRNSNKILTGKFQGKRFLGKLWHRGEGNFKIGFRKHPESLIKLAQDTAQWQTSMMTLMILQVW
jgi:hypothetical protein